MSWVHIDIVGNIYHIVGAISWVLVIHDIKTFPTTWWMLPTTWWMLPTICIHDMSTCWTEHVCRGYKSDVVGTPNLCRGCIFISWVTFNISWVHMIWCRGYMSSTTSKMFPTTSKCSPRHDGCSPRHVPTICQHVGRNMYVVGTNQMSWVHLIYVVGAYWYRG